MGFVDNDFKKIKPVKQSHRNSCWAACLEWWQRANNFSAVYTQKALRNEADLKAMYNSDSTTGQVHAKSHANYGVLEKHELLSVFGQPRFNMFVYDEPAITSDEINWQFHRKGPIIIGYFDSMVGGNHLNVICGYDSELQFAEVMEPRTGKFTEKGFSEFLSGGGAHILGWKRS